MKRMTMSRTSFSVTAGIISAVISPLFLPIAVLVALNLLDYITAIIATKLNGGVVRSDVGIKGIYKKAMMWMVVAVAVMIDVLLSYAAQQFGLPSFTSMYISVVCVMWLCVNEVISVLENVAKFGDNVPPIFYGVVIKLQQWLKGDNNNGDNPAVRSEHGDKSL